MVTKPGALEKHLTVEVQSLLKSKGGNAAGMAMLNSFKPESGLQSFETGDLLFSYTDSAQHTKYEVQVDNDDLAGDEDSLSLSIHSFRDGKEQDDEWNLMSTHFTVSMKLQQNVWRLDKISVGAELPVGDGNFVRKLFFPAASGGAAGVAVVPGWHTSVGSDLGAEGTSSPAMAPEEVVTMLAFAEGAFAQQHPDAGFTCSLSELAQWLKMVGVDQQVATGTYNGYRFALSGCEGKPAGSFQITAEPLVAGKGAKAFCTDATRNLRESDDGQGATCVVSGKVHQSSEDIPAVGLDVHVHDTETDPKQ